MHLYMMYIFYIFVCMCVYQSTDEVFLLDQAVCGQAPLNSLHIMALHCPVLARILLSQFSSLARIPFPLTFPPSNYPSTDHHPAPWLCCLVTVLCLTLYDPMDCSPTGPSVHGISQARILEWVAIPSSRESSQPRGQYSSFSLFSTLSPLL